MVNEDISCLPGNSEQPKSTRRGLLADLKGESHMGNSTASPSRGSPIQPATIRDALTRPTRVTRATAPIYDKSEVVEKVVKFSENPGLGKPWDK